MIKRCGLTRPTLILLSVLSLLLLFSVGCQSETPTVIALPASLTPVSAQPTAAVLSSPTLEPSPTGVPTVAPSPTLPPTIPPTTAPTIAPTTIPSPTRPNTPTNTSVAANRAGVDLVGLIGGGATSGLAVIGKYAFIPIGQRLVVFDVTIAHQPQVVGEGPILPERITGIAVFSSYCYLAAGYSGVYVLNVSNPIQPVLIGEPLKAAFAVQVVAANGNLYLADSDSNGGLAVFRLTDPAHPVAIARIPLQYGYRRIAANGQYLYALSDVLHVFDMSDPAHPKEIGPSSGMPTGSDLSSSGNLVAIAYATFSHVSTGKLILVDVSNPTGPAVASTMDMDSPALRVTISENFTFVATYSGVRIIDTSDPKHPREVGSYRALGMISGIERAGDKLYVTTAVGENLRILDITHPEQPAEQGAYRTPRGAQGVAVSGRYAYVADAGGGLLVIDLSDARAPITIGATTPFYANGVTCGGHYCYVAWPEGMRVFDVADPARPTEVGAISLKGGAETVTVVGDWAYLAAGDNGLVVVNVSNPSAPAMISSSKRPYQRDIDLDVAGDYAYLASGYELRIVRIADPAHPAEVARIPMGGTVYSVRVAGGYAYVAGPAGLSIFDISRPAQPVAVGSFSTAHARSVALVNSVAFLGDGPDGLRVLDIANPGRPTQIAYNATEAYQVAVVGDYIYLLNDDGALAILRYRRVQ